MKYEAVIFDLDGTLWNANESCTKGWNNALAELGYQGRISVKDMDSVTGKSIAECIDTLLPGIRNEFIDITNIITNAEKRAVDKFGASIYPGVQENIKTLSLNHKVFIVSNCQESYLTKFIEYSGLSSVLSGWDCYGSSLKEKHIMISNIKRKNNIEKVLYVGDTYHDQESAILSGSDFFQVTYGFGAPIKNAVMVNSFSGLISYISDNV